MSYLRRELHPKLYLINNGIRNVYNAFLNADNTSETAEAIISQMDDLIREARMVYTTLDIELVRTFDNATSAVDGLFRTMSPKCDAEFNYLFDDQHHQQRQFGYTLDALLSHVRSVRDRYSTFQDQYMSRRLTLSQLDKLYDFEELITFLNGDVRAVTPVITSLAVLVHKYEYHASDVISWIRAQSSNSYVVANSTYAHDIRRRAIQINNTLSDVNGSYVGETLHDDADSAEVVWQNFYQQLEAFTQELELHRQTLKTSARESHQYLTEFIRGNQINEAFFRYFKA